jgi:hypothetical protein
MTSSRGSKPGENPGPERADPGAPASSWKRVVPSPWVDCGACGWRHYPDSGRRQGPRVPTTCANCGQVLEAPDDATGAAGS